MSRPTIALSILKYNNRLKQELSKVFYIHIYLDLCFILKKNIWLMYVVFCFVFKELSAITSSNVSHIKNYYYYSFCNKLMPD